MEDSTNVAVAVLVIGVFGLAACTLAMSQLLPRAQRRWTRWLPGLPSFRRRSARSARNGRPGSVGAVRPASTAASRSASSAAGRSTSRAGSAPSGGVTEPTVARRSSTSNGARRAAGARGPIAGVPARDRVDVGGAGSPVRPSRQPAMRPDVLRRERERIDAEATRRYIDQMAEKHPEVLAEVVGELLAQDRDVEGRPPTP